MKASFCLFAILWALPPWGAEAASPAGDEGITRAQADAILAELKAIHELLSRGRGPSTTAGTKVRTSMRIEVDDNILGSKSAPLTIVEFTDYQCPFCRQFHLATFPEIRKKYVDTGKVRYIPCSRS
jgi:protein-disulfide isomerase